MSDSGAGGPRSPGEAHDQQHEEAPPAKRPRTEPQPPEAHEATTEPAADNQDDDKLAQALSRIASHISNPSKFAKASGLLRQLIEGGKIDRAHRKEYFSAVKAAFSDPDNAANPQLVKEYKRLVTAVSEHADLLGKAERAQLEVYNIWTHQRSQLFTDDSFAFNKALTQLKAVISELPDADEEQQHAVDVLAGRVPDAAPAAAAGAPAAADESDPFGLDQFLEAEDKQRQQQEQRSEPAPAKQPQLAWSPTEQLVMRKQALLDCLLAAKQQHRLAWAQTSVELLITHADQHRSKFVAGEQQQQLDELMKFVRGAQLARKSGRGGGSKAPGMTSFEQARAQWSTATVSHRGKVGSQGDATSNNWLG
jgi:hypothetical protein